MTADSNLQMETDPRFPSGPWVGYFLQKSHPGKSTMELRLTFRGGAMTGEGRDWVGQFHIKGQYNVADGKCYWSKKYLGKHDVFYQGYNEGKGIWGTWEIGYPTLGVLARGGFHIWPEGLGTETDEYLVEEADLPAQKNERIASGTPS